MTYTWTNGDPRPYSQQFEFLVDVLNGDALLNPPGIVPTDGLTELDALCAEVVDWARAHPDEPNPYPLGRPRPSLRRLALLTLLDRLQAFVRRRFS